MATKIEIIYWPNAQLFSVGHIAINISPADRIQPESGTDDGYSSLNSSIEDIFEPRAPEELYISWANLETFDASVEQYGNDYISINFPLVDADTANLVSHILKTVDLNSMNYALATNNCSHKVAQILLAIDNYTKTSTFSAITKIARNYFLRPKKLALSLMYTSYHQFNSAIKKQPEINKNALLLNVWYILNKNFLAYAYRLLFDGTSFSQENFIKLIRIIQHCESFMKNSNVTESQKNSLLDKIDQTPVLPPLDKIQAKADISKLGIVNGMNSFLA